jgi:hypothetical protein
MQTDLVAPSERAILMETVADFYRTIVYFFRVSLMVRGVSFWTVTLRVNVV